ncbi:D-alanyl-D-alanine carboxypeptidase family protein [Microbacterium thalli]|uniref:D-alanyl-D-alanine carboxypeptidase family protein n=1 Tax=Microbacterium thalli TaxID=3027921 RepID=UPI00236556D1|nr:D-alanyl-D-alanine carboxypeptidase [Microbacterium thalli]MDD7928657.1 D-alanyl-D-alanine carboxypeptidase [Microbacterium thalli]
MSSGDASATTRRARRDAADKPGRIALAWVDEDAVAGRSPRQDLAASAGPYAIAHADLLADRPRRLRLGAGAAVPALGIPALIVGGYAASTLLWPLDAVAPTVLPALVAAPAAAAAQPAWPADGAGATAVEGLGATAASSGDAASIASITKLVTALVVLDQQPLGAGERGPEFTFTTADRREYRAYLADDQSALDVPVDGVLTQYQLLQGVLIGSANNYADRLVSELWPNDEVYARAANAWLDEHGLSGITVVDPSGIDSDNIADPASVIALGRAAMANPVIAEIVGQRSVDLPGAGLVENTNALLANPAVVGIKTGSLFGSFNLVAAQEATFDGTTIRAYAAALGQPDDETRHSATAAMLDRTLAEVAASPSLAAGTLAGTVTTVWGASADIVTDADVRVALWNAQAAQATPEIDLGDARAAGDAVGELVLTGPLGSATTALQLASDIPDPDAWWRLSHPLQLWGLTD